MVGMQHGEKGEKKDGTITKKQQLLKYHNSGMKASVLNLKL